MGDFLFIFFSFSLLFFFFDRENSWFQNWLTISLKETKVLFKFNQFLPPRSSLSPSPPRMMRFFLSFHLYLSIFPSYPPLQIAHSISHLKSLGAPSSCIVYEGLYGVGYRLVRCLVSLGVEKIIIFSRFCLAEKAEKRLRELKRFYYHFNSYFLFSFFFFLFSFFFFLFSFFFFLFSFFFFLFSFFIFHFSFFIFHFFLKHIYSNIY